MRRRYGCISNIKQWKTWYRRPICARHEAERYGPMYDVVSEVDSAGKSVLASCRRHKILRSNASHVQQMSIALAIGSIVHSTSLTIRL